MKRVDCRWTAVAVALLAGQARADTTLKLTEVITSPQRTDSSRSMSPGSRRPIPACKVEVVSLPWGQAFEKLATMVQGGQIPTWSRCPSAGWRSMPTTASSRVSKPWMDQVARGQAS